MASVVFHPDTSLAGRGVLEVRIKENIYTLEPGVPQDIPQEHFAAVQTAILAAGPGPLIANAPVCVVTPTGGAAGTYDYHVAPFNDQGDDLPHATTHITNGPTTLDVTHFNTITWVDVAPTGVKGYHIVRTAGGTTQGLIASIAPGVQTFKDDNSEGAATAYVPAGANPATFGAPTGPAEI